MLDTDKNPWRPTNPMTEMVMQFDCWRFEYLYPYVISVFPRLTTQVVEPFTVAMSDGTGWTVEAGDVTEYPVAWRKRQVCSPLRPIVRIELRT